MLSTSAASPSPAAPPGFPTRPPESSEKDGLAGMMMLIFLAAVVIMGMVMGAVHVYWFDFSDWKFRGNEENEVVQTKSYIQEFNARHRGHDDKQDDDNDTELGKKKTWMDEMPRSITIAKHMDGPKITSVGESHGITNNPAQSSMSTHEGTTE